MRLTMRTSLALRAAMICAARAPSLMRTNDIAAAAGASPAHMSYVVHRLRKAGILASVRGRSGGVRLAAGAETTTVRAIVEVFDGDTPFAECFRDGAGCPLAGPCRLGSVFCDALAAFYRVLDETTISDLVAGNAPFEARLSA